MEHIVYKENRAMQYVVAIDKFRNITKAAQSLYISQPTLSKFVQSLEARLGFQIFIRSGIKLLPTHEGEVLISYARQICDIEARMSNELTDLIYNNRGRIRLAVPNLRSPHLLPMIIPPFAEKYPDVEIELREVHSKYLEKMLIDGEVDFAILNTSVNIQGIYSEKLKEEEILLVVPSDHPLCSQGQITQYSKYPQIDISLFRDEGFILQPTEQRTRQIADSIFKQANIKPSVLLITRSIETAVLTVSNGCGVCFSPESYIQHTYTKRKPQLFSLKYQQAFVTLNLAYFEGVHMPTYMHDFALTIRKAVTGTHDIA